jgi:molecular chaperone DnaK
MSKIIGIDLGTTNSVVAVMEGGEPPSLQTRRVAERPVRRCLYERRQSSRRTSCQTSGSHQPENTVYSIKRFMGRRYNEVSEEIKQVPYKVQGAGKPVM